jgi:hypothetical protein
MYVGRAKAEQSKRNKRKNTVPETECVLGTSTYDIIVSNVSNDGR